MALIDLSIEKDGIVYCVNGKSKYHYNVNGNARNPKCLFFSIQSYYHLSIKRDGIVYCVITEINRVKNMQGDGNLLP